MRSLLFFSVLILLGSCIEPFDPEIEEYSDSLVVEGSILEGKNPATVKLSRSFGFDEQAPVMVTDATVGIRDDQGNETLLQEITEGIYQSDTNQLSGVVGLSYQLFIETEGGESYESSWVEMKKSLPIDELYSKYIQKEEGVSTTQGMQVYLSAHDPERQSKYYRWEYEETWLILVPFPALGIWNRQTSMPEYYSIDEVPGICWQTDSSSTIITHSSEGLTEDRVIDFPIRFISTRGNHLRFKYSILVKQFTMNPEAFEYYQKLKKITQDLGTLSDPIPSEITGNIRNIDRPEEFVIGLFSAEGFSSRRIFIKRQELPAVSILSGLEYCLLDTLSGVGEMNIFYNGGGVFVDEIFDDFGNWIGYSGTERECADCRLSGTLVKPDFWE